MSFVLLPAILEQMASGHLRMMRWENGLEIDNMGI